MSPEKVALVTGANRGLGRGTAEELARRGWAVVVTARDPERAQAAAEEIGAATGGTVVGCALDVTSSDDARRAADLVGDRFGRLDALVNNAGAIFDSPADDALSTDPEVVLQSFENNSLGALRVAQAMAPLLRDGGGNVVNVSSGMGALSEMGGGYPGYRISKTALNGITALLHAELGGDGVRVNSVCPGWVRTDMGGPNANRALGEGVSGIVWAATLEAGGPSGGFFRDGRRIDW